MYPLMASLIFAHLFSSIYIANILKHQKYTKNILPLYDIVRNLSLIFGEKQKKKLMRNLFTLQQTCYNRNVN